jgi:hypothetical protein
VQAFVTAGGGFLLAVLWFDLMFDVQVRGGATDEAVESIATYYARVTRAARPMNRLVALAMLATIVAVVAELIGDSVPRWAGWASLALILLPVGVAGGRTVPAAVRLGQRTDPPEARRVAAEAILRQHLFCLASIAALLAVQLASLADG